MDDNDTNKEAKFVLLDHLRSSYERQWLWKENLETKSNNAVKTSGLIFGILFGLFSIPFASISSNDGKIILPEMAIYFLIFAIVASMISIVFATLATKLKNHPFVFTHAKDIEEVYVNSGLTNLEKEKKAEKIYIKSIDEFLQINLGKTKKIKYTQYFMTASVVLLMVSLIITLDSINNFTIWNAVQDIVCN